jgi:hypothetical protein
MNDMITKTQLIDGLPFTYKSCKYTLHKDEGYVTNGLYGYVGNIDKIGTRSLTVYTHVMGKQVRVKVNYRDCKLVDNQ